MRLTDQLRGMTSRAPCQHQRLAAGAAARCSRRQLVSRGLNSCEESFERLDAAHALEREYGGGEGDAAVAPYWRRELKGGRI